MDNAVRDKLDKLRRLSKSPNRNEARLARAMLEKLAARHGVDPDAPEAAPFEEEKIVIEHYGIPHRLAGTIVLRICPVQILVYERISRRIKSRQVGFLGTADDVRAAMAIFERIVHAMMNGFRELEGKCIFCFGAGCWKCSSVLARTVFTVPIVESRPGALRITDSFSFYVGVFDSLGRQIDEEEARKAEQSARAQRPDEPRDSDDVSSSRSPAGLLSDVDGAGTALAIVGPGEQIRQFAISELPHVDPERQASEPLRPQDAASFEAGGKYAKNVRLYSRLLLQATDLHKAHY